MSNFISCIFLIFAGLLLNTTTLSDKLILSGISQFRQLCLFYFKYISKYVGATIGRTLKTNIFYIHGRAMHAPTSFAFNFSEISFNLLKLNIMSICLS